jgi:hypothetical protein
LFRFIARQAQSGNSRVRPSKSEMRRLLSVKDERNQEAARCGRDRDHGVRPITGEVGQLGDQHADDRAAARPDRQNYFASIHPGLGHASYARDAIRTARSGNAIAE